MSPRSRSHHSPDILPLHGALRVARRGRRRRRSRWAEEPRERGEPRGAAPCSAITPAQGPPGTSAASGSGTTGCETRRTARPRSPMARWKAQAGSPGASRGSCTPALPYSLSVLSSILLALETRVSRHQRYGWWVHHSSSPVSRVVCYELPFVYSRSLAADGGPTTRRAEDCRVAERARKCPSRAAGADAAAEAGSKAARAPVLRNVHPRAVSTRPPATCPASPAGKRTSACDGTAPHHTHPLSHCSRRQYNRWQQTTVHYSGVDRVTVRLRRTRVREVRAVWVVRASQVRLRLRLRLHWPQPRRVGLLPATCPSPADPTGNSCSAPLSCDPNPQAIKVAIPLFLPAYTPDDLTLSMRDSPRISVK